MDEISYSHLRRTKSVSKYFYTLLTLSLVDIAYYSCVAVAASEMDRMGAGCSKCGWTGFEIEPCGCVFELTRVEKA
jgi:hypothetical protein